MSLVLFTGDLKLTLDILGFVLNVYKVSGIINRIFKTKTRYSWVWNFRTKHVAFKTQTAAQKSFSFRILAATITCQWRRVVFFLGGAEKKPRCRCFNCPYSSCPCSSCLCLSCFCSSCLCSNRLCSSCLCSA